MKQVEVEVVSKLRVIMLQKKGSKTAKVQIYDNKSMVHEEDRPPGEAAAFATMWITSNYDIIVDEKVVRSG